MKLFDEGARTDRKPKAYATALFEYYNSSGRESVGALRAMLEQWYDRYPGFWKHDLRQRFRSDDDSEHYGAFFELYCFELSVGLGFDVEVHPESLPESDRRPDFLLSRNGKPLLYLESTVVLGPQQDQGAAARLDQIYDAINDVSSPDFWLQIELDGRPDATPSLTGLKSEVRSFLGGLNWETVTRDLPMDLSLGDLPSFEWRTPGMRVTISAIPKSTDKRGTPEVRPLGFILDGVRVVTDESPIRNALNRKAKHYKGSDLPLIVAVDCLLSHVDSFTIMNALFGQEGMAARFDAHGDTVWEPFREPNGVWWGPKGPKCTTLSGVLFAINLTPWNAALVEPVLYHNPWAAIPATPDWLPFEQHVPSEDRSRLERRSGTSVRDFLRFAEDWPDD